MGGIVIVAAALLGALLLAPGSAAIGGAEAAASKRISLGDNFFSPTSTKSKKGQRVKFKWIGAARHNVTLKKGPGKKFKSKTTSKKGVNYDRKFKKRGTYKIFCTIHPDQMKLTLKVK